VKTETCAANGGESRHRARLLKLIISYKLVKACTVLGLAAVLAVMIVTGVSPDLYRFATRLREHATAAWAMRVAGAMVSATEHRHLVVVTSALFLDGISTCVEWYALARGHTWGEWFVVVATSLLLPFEVVAFVRGQHVGRLVILLVNIVIVLYLMRHAMRAARARVGSATLGE